MEWPRAQSNKFSYINVSGGSSVAVSPLPGYWPLMLVVEEVIKTQLLVPKMAETVVV